MKVPFKKMHGCGNDFIMIDNRKGIMRALEISNFVKLVCRRRFHIGADGLILLENSEVATIKMRYFNSDGSEGEMCGNGARCIVKYASLLGLVKDVITFETLNGIYKGRILSERVQIKFPSLPIKDFYLNQHSHSSEGEISYHHAWVGVPHTLFIGDDIDDIKSSDFIDWAYPIRHNKLISNSGTNVNKVEILNKNQIKIRTYERGVDDETYACGSGAVASGIMSSLLGEVSSPIEIYTKGGVLTVSFQIKEKYVQDILLEGNAIVVAEGNLLLNAEKSI